ncbi:MAG: sulfatase-like hydrolase/transferase [Planctomycetes bacterium]|nr:sulfatase-like hydrolase/transferase [Planctomycetota bacterium]
MPGMISRHERSNLLVLFADQQRADTLGCYGQQLPVSPAIDRLAAEGVRFANAFTCQPVCGPARAALQTGLWPTDLDCQVNDRALPRDAKTIAHHLGDAGWQTGYFGKWHLASDNGGRGRDREVLENRVAPVPPDLRGGWRDGWVAADVLEFTSHGYGGHMFDREGRRVDFPPGRFRADCVTDHLLAWLEHGRDPQRPFAAMISWIEPHHQNDRGCYEGPAGSAERFAGFVPPGDLAAFRGIGDWEKQYPDYLGCCNAIDANVARIRACLERHGVWEDTVVVYTADHGSHFKTRNREYKRSAHDASLRIPMIVHGPGFTGGRVEEGLASLIDLPRTLLGAAGLHAPCAMQGRDLAGGGADAVFVQISESQCGRAIREAGWTYAVRAPDTPSDARTSVDGRWVEDVLYDNTVDPHQLRNLVADPAAAQERARLRARLEAWMRARGDAVTAIIPAA